MNRALRRSNVADLPDPRLWDHEPLQWQRWVEQFTEVLGFDPLSARDEMWAQANGWEWTYYPDGSKTAYISKYGKTISFPSRESLVSGG